MMRVVDLFSGCGGLSLGFQLAGYDVAAAFDNWRPTMDIYSKNFKHPVIDLDLSSGGAYERVAEFGPEIIIGGPPCQDFSSAGKRNEDGGRGSLTVAFAKIIQKIKPRYFLMENVDRIIKTKKLIDVIEIFSNAGFGLSYTVLDASFCGVPQQRKRFMMIGERNGNNDALMPYFQKNLSKRPMTVRDYVGDAWGIEHYYRHPRNYSRRAIYSMDEPSATIRGVNRPIPKGYPGHNCDSCKITEEIRPLTTKERAQIQTFPADFIFVGNKTNVEQIIGNAVPVNLAKYVANCLKEYLSDKNSGKTLNNALF
ncbi:MAG: DNA cytosine methyltransferase [Holophagaceae bacterium]|nr:DNA cytosine methyltransferase [Holophagaceae bacterium]